MSYQRAAIEERWRIILETKFGNLNVFDILTAEDETGVDDRSWSKQMEELKRIYNESPDHWVRINRDLPAQLKDEQANGL